MILTVLVLIVKKWKKPKYPSTDNWSNKMGYYPAIKRNEVLIHDTPWMDLENMTLRSQSQRTTYYAIPSL